MDLVVIGELCVFESGVNLVYALVLEVGSTFGRLVDVLMFCLV